METLKSFLTRPEYQNPATVKLLTTMIMDNKLTPSQIGGFLVALKLLHREDDPATVHAVAEAMREASVQLPQLDDIVDIVGTGGDGQNTFNVSTAASIVCAGAGLKVAKHGNRASSSSCGSADVLEQLGCLLANVGPNSVSQVFTESNFCFLFAQMFHPAMKLGPLTNPAKPRKMVVGVFSKEIGPVMAQALRLGGVERAWVVHGALGLDEISPEGVTYVWDLLSDGTIVEKTISPADFGLESHSLAMVRGGDAHDNAQIMRDLLDDELDGPVLDFVLMNAAALLFVAGKTTSLKDAVYLARESISSGRAREALAAFAAVTRKLKQ